MNRMMIMMMNDDDNNNIGDDDDDVDDSNVKVEAGLRSSAQHVTEETAKVLFASITCLVKISETISLYNWYLDAKR